MSKVHCEKLSYFNAENKRHQKLEKFISKNNSGVKFTVVSHSHICIPKKRDSLPESFSLWLSKNLII